MFLQFNIFLFIGYFFGLGYNISFTDYKVQSGKDVMRLVYAFMVSALFWVVTQFYIPIKPSDVTFWKFVQVAAFFIFGWANVEVLLLIVNNGKAAITNWVIAKIKGLWSTDKTPGGPALQG